MFSKYSLYSIFHLAWPIILSNMAIPLPGLVDTVVMGHLPSQDYLAAIAMGGVVYSFLFWVFGFLRMGTTGMVSQCLSRMQTREALLIFMRSSLLALGLSGILLLLKIPLSTLGITLFSATDEVRELAEYYVDIRLWSTPAVLLNYVYLGWFFALKNTRIPLYGILLINSSNILMDIGFVQFMGMHVEGVALASVIAEYLGLCYYRYCFYKMRSNSPLEGLQKHLWKEVWHWQKLTTLLDINRFLFIRTALLLASFVFFTWQGAKMGTTIIAANALLLNFQTVVAYALDGFAHAAEILAGYAAGRQKQKDLREVVVHAGLCSFFMAILFSLFFYFCGGFLLSLMTNIEGVRLQALEYLPWLVLMPILAVSAYLFDGIFIGATWVREMSHAMFLAVIIYLVCWFISKDLGNHGLWFSLSVFLLVRGVLLACAYQKLEQSLTCTH